jgi:hypothetical protein
MIKETRKTKEQFIDEMSEYIKTMPEEERADFGIAVMFHAVLWGGCNDLVMLGMLECAKMDIINEVINYNGDEDDGDEWKKLLNKN